VIAELREGWHREARPTVCFQEAGIIA